MDDRQKQAARGIAAGKTIEDVSNEVNRSPQAIMRWMEEPEMQAAVIRGIRVLGLLTLAEYLKHGGDQKTAMAALATLRWLGAGKTKPRGSPKEPEVEDETDLGEFSEESLKRLKGDS